jgi:hypothetical protein
MRPDEKKHLLWIMLLTALIVVAFRIEINPIGWKYFHWANWDCGLAFFIGLIVSAGKEVVWDKWLHRGTPQFYDAMWGTVGAIIGPGIVLFVEAIIVEVIPAIIKLF